MTFEFSPWHYAFNAFLCVWTGWFLNSAWRNHQEAKRLRAKIQQLDDLIERDYESVGQRAEDIQAALKKNWLAGKNDRPSIKN